MYQRVLELEPQNAQAQKAIDEMKRLMTEERDFDLEKDFQHMFDRQHLMEKIAKNPKLASYMMQPDFSNKLNELQKNPQALSK
jgi:hypothetical protein